MLERLQKIIAHSGIASRRHAEQLILSGQVLVNGKVVRELGTKVDVGLVPTLLGLHSKPPEFKDGGEYVDYAVRKLLPEVAGSNLKPRFSDCFCEEGVFSREECSRYLRASTKAGFALKIHADEFGDSGGASLAGELRCVSADHLGRSSKAGIQMMAKRGYSWP